MVDTMASWIGLTVSAHREGSPNRSCSRCASAAEYRRRCGSMRIWQRNAIACTRTPDRSVIVSENVTVGVAAYRSAVAPVQPKIRSAMSAAFQDLRAPPQPVKERPERGAGLRAAVEALPAQPQLADQRVALVDRDQEDLIPFVSAVHEDGLDVGGQRPEQRV